MRWQKESVKFAVSVEASLIVIGKPSFSILYRLRIKNFFRELTNLTNKENIDLFLIASNDDNKNKIIFGLGGLFLLILLWDLPGLVSSNNHFAQKSKGTIVDNYHSIGYTVSMMDNLDIIYQMEQKKLLDTAVDSTHSRFFVGSKIKF